MTGLHSVKAPEREERTEVWVASGLKLAYRVCSLQHTYGEFEKATDATAFLGLLLLGNPNLRRLL